jgi:hypothetical protein
VNEAEVAGENKNHSLNISNINFHSWNLVDTVSIEYCCQYIYMGMPVRRGFAPGFVNYKKGVLDSQPQVIKFTSYLPMFGGSLHVLRLLPPLKLVAINIGCFG